MSSSIASLARDLYKTITESDKRKVKPYDSDATVVKVEDDVVWVKIPGGVDVTPVKKTIDAKEGDTVKIRVSDHRAWITGNNTAPPTDDTTAKVAYNKAESASNDAARAFEAANNAEQDAIRAHEAADRAEMSANEAKVSAQNANEYASRSLASLSTVQSVSETLTWITQHGTMTLTTDTQLDPTHVYFVVDATGDYVVNNTHYSLVTEPNADDLSTYYELSIDESLNNYVGTHLALTGEGLWLLPATSGTNKVLIATGGGTTYTTAGTYIVNSTGGIEASFRSNGVTIGQVLNGYSRTEIGTNGMQIIQRDDGTDTAIANMGYGDGVNSAGQSVPAPFYTLGRRLSGSTVGNYSTAEGVDVTASGYLSHAEGYKTVASGMYSHAEGGSSEPGIGGCIASGNRSHAGGTSTIASGASQTAIGMYNVADDDNAFGLIVGNGTAPNDRCNALGLTWGGDLRLQGDVYIGCDEDSTGGTKLVNGGGGGGGVTYDLSISGHTITLNGSDGSHDSVTVPDANTTYTLSMSGRTITLTPSSGTADTITIPYASYVNAGVLNGRVASGSPTAVWLEFSFDGTNFYGVPRLVDGVVQEGFLPTMTAPTSSANGTAGIVPTPYKLPNNSDSTSWYFLTEQGTWRKLNLTSSRSATSVSVSMENRRYGSDGTLIDTTTSSAILNSASTSNAGVMSAADKTKLDNILELVYPVGSVYESINNVDPSTYFGGTWQSLDSGGSMLVTSNGDYLVTDSASGVTLTYKWVRTA